MSINITLGLVALCLVAALLGAFARWCGQKANWADWATFALGLFVFGLVILAAHLGG